jgi:exopolyphosphatase/guanosine-5'-triphosphate,3'-diphosphate pyrophosphatase
VDEIIIPRWEWRTFADRGAAADARFDALEPEQVRDSDETYLVSAATDASVKLRDELVDVKVLVDTDADGLQQWRPVLKAPFPLSAADVRELMQAAGVSDSELVREAYTRDQLAALLIGAETLLITIEVHKRRAHYTLDGCMAERSELRTEHGSRHTIGIESEDPVRVSAVVRELGFDTQANVSLPHELKALARLA